MSGQGSGGSSSGGSSLQMQASSLPGGYQPMDCESSPRHSGSRRAITTGYPSTSSSATGGVPASSAPMSMQSMDSSLIQSSLGSYNSLILPGIPHLPAMMTSPMIQQQNFYNYGYSTTDTHGMVRQPSTVSTGNQRDPEREDSPMVGVCVQQSPVAIHWDGEEERKGREEQPTVDNTARRDRRTVKNNLSRLIAMDGARCMLRTFIVATKRREKDGGWRRDGRRNISESFPPTLLSQHRVKRDAVPRDTDASSTCWQWIQPIFRIRWYVRRNNSENAQKKFPGKSQNSPQATGEEEAPGTLHLSVCRETTGAKKCSGNASSAALNDYVREQRIQRVEENAREEEESESAREIFVFRYVAVFSYFLPSWLALHTGRGYMCMHTRKINEELRAWTDSNGLVRMNPAGLSGPARFHRLHSAELRF